MDGLIYSSIAHNLANGIGTFWKPHFTATCYPQFYEHPPLAFGIQSVLYGFSDNLIMDKIYSFITGIVTTIILLKTWKLLGYKNGWFVLFCWLTTSIVFWAYPNNMLENTMVIFTSASILFYLRYHQKQSYIDLILAGFMLAMGFLTKGFVAFFPWVLPFLMWLFLRKHSFYTALKESIGMLVFTLAPLALIIIIFPEAETNIRTYIETQVINSIKNIKTVDSRIYILGRLFFELLPAIGLSLLLIIIGWLRKFPLKKLLIDYKMACIFILLGLSGVIPMMVSMKQSGFYLLTTIPIFAFGISIFLNPLIEHFVSTIKDKSNGFYILRYLAIGSLLIGISLSLYFIKSTPKDSVKINDTKLIVAALPKGAIINTQPALWEDWGLQGYYCRYKNVSLDPDLKNKREYLLIMRNSVSVDTLSNYTLIYLNTSDYQLYKLITK